MTDAAHAYDYDLVVIGSGPAGEKGAAQAAYFGKRVAVIEARQMGGTCVHTGTIPSKALRESALCLSGLRVRGIAGVVQPSAGAIGISDLMAHREQVSEEAAQTVRRNLDRHDVDVFEGRGELEDAHTIRIRPLDGGGAGRTITGAHVLIATGSRPRRPDSIPFDGVEVYDSDDILNLDHVPKSLAVIGGGVIGCEYASIFAALGVEVTLIDPHEHVMTFLDRDVRQALVEGFDALGMRPCLGAPITEVRVEGPDQVVVQVEGRDPLRVDKLLFAAGRLGNTDGLGLEKVGIEPDSRGLLEVDEHLRTSCPNIYAAGDVIGFPALASTSMDQGRTAVCHAFALDYKDDLPDRRHLPFGIYTVPACSMIGDTVQALEERGEDYEIGRTRFGENPRGGISGARGGLLKLVFRPDDKRLLGVHIVGEQAAELVHVGMMVLQLGGTIDAFIDAVFNYPTFSEAYKYAAYDGLGRLAARAGLRERKVRDRADTPSPRTPAPDRGT